ncbi:MAG: hypothetical protein V3S33_08730, partial [Gammaproteobacteria bacterium]
MDSNQVKKWLTLIANIGVLFGLALVAFELQQNSELMRIQINQARADAAMLSNEQLFNSPYLPSIILKSQQGSELSGEERIRYINWFRAINRNQDNILSQYFAGMLGEHTPGSVADFARDVVASSSYSREAWRITK